MGVYNEAKDAIKELNLIEDKKWLERAQVATQAGYASEDEVAQLLNDGEDKNVEKH